MTAAHNADVRPTPNESRPDIADEMLTDPPPKNIGVFDDLMTTGEHYVAARRILAARFPQAAIFGLFIARRAPETTDFSDVFGELE